MKLKPHGHACTSYHFTFYGSCTGYAGFQADAADVYLVGDSLRDLQAIAAGGQAVLVKTGKGMKTLQNDADKLPENTLVFDDLLAFSQFLIQPSADTTA